MGYDSESYSGSKNRSYADYNSNENGYSTYTKDYTEYTYTSGSRYKGLNTETNKYDVSVDDGKSSLDFLNKLKASEFSKKDDVGYQGYDYPYSNYSGKTTVYE